MVLNRRTMSFLHKFVKISDWNEIVWKLDDWLLLHGDTDDIRYDQFFPELVSVVWLYIWREDTYYAYAIIVFYISRELTTYAGECATLEIDITFAGIFNIYCQRKGSILVTSKPRSGPTPNHTQTHTRIKSTLMQELRWKIKWMTSGSVMLFLVKKMLS